jgi:activator of 2-hydroxyglutaryl-CoA dehydratase
VVLGVDASSTTTKAVLLDGGTGGIVAWHYGRTCGAPVQATRRCLRAMAAQVGGREIGLMTATGSARELIGAYLGTTCIYNEISAHATGAARFDSDVDTIFEIGGQDAKYILLRNRVAVDVKTGRELWHCDLGSPIVSSAAISGNAVYVATYDGTIYAFTSTSK